METPIFSVLIPYFKKDFIVQTLESVKNQYFTNYEIIIGNDSDDDYIFGLAERYGAICMDNPDKKSVGNYQNVRNLLLKAQGSYIKILCDDDLLNPFALQCYYSAFKLRPDISLVFSASYIVDQNNLIISKRDFLPKESIYDGIDIVKHCLQSCHNKFGEFSTFAFNRDRYVKSRRDIRDFFGLETWGVSDFVTACNMAVGYKVYYFKDALSCFRRHSRSATAIRRPTFVDSIRSWFQMAVTAKKLNIINDQEYGTALRTVIGVYRRNAHDYPVLSEEANEIAKEHGFGDLIESQSPKMTAMLAG